MNTIINILFLLLFIIVTWFLMKPSKERYTNITLNESSYENVEFIQPLQKYGSYNKTPLWENDETIYSGDIECKNNSQNQFNCSTNNTPYQCTINYGYSFDDDGYISCEECHYSPKNHRECIRQGQIYSTCIKNPRSIGLGDIQQYIAEIQNK